MRDGHLIEGGRVVAAVHGWSDAAIAGLPEGRTFLPGDPASRQVGSVWPAADDVKAECGRRITDVYPIERQLNMQARATELQEIRLAGGTLSPDEAAEADALKQAFRWIKDMRAASNTLEAAEIPADFAADHHWPASPA